MSLDFEHFIGLNPIPQAAIFHPDGQKYFYSSGALIVIGDLTDPHSQEFLRGHDDSITVLKVSKSGKLIASGQLGGHSDIIVWDYASRRMLYRFEEHDHMIQDIAFSEDGKILASIGGSDDGNLIVWDMSNGCIISSACRLPVGTTCITFAGFIKDIKRRDTNRYQFVTGGKDGVISVWDLDPYSGEMNSNRIVTDNARAMLTRHVTSFAVSEDREYLYAGTTSGDYLIISLRNQRITRAITATRMAIHNLVCTRDVVVLGCGDKGVKMYQTNGDFIRQVELDGGIIGLSLSNDQREVLATTSVGTIVRLNLHNMQHIVISEAHVAPITQMAFDIGNGGRFATASVDGTIKVWDMAEYAVIATCYPRREQKAGVRPLCLVFADIIISGWSDGRVLAFSAETGENLWMLVDAHVGTSNRDFDDAAVGVTSMVMSHNRRFLLTGGPTGDVRLWELRTRDLISHLKEHKQRITKIVLTQDDTIALTASRDRCILRWDLRQEKRLLCYMQRMGGINDVVLLGANDEFLISVGQDRKLVLWDARSQDVVYHEVLDREREDDEEGCCLARSKCGRYLVTGGTQGVLRLWELQWSVLESVAAYYRNSLSNNPVNSHQQQNNNNSHYNNHNNHSNAASRSVLPGAVPPPRLNQSPFRLLQTVSAHSKKVVSVDFGLQDKQVVSVGEDGSVFVFFFFGADEV